MSKIKRLLEAYVFARPHIRLSLKVLKTKGEYDWSYAPKKTNDVQVSKNPATPLADAVLQAFGKRVAGQCQWQSSSFPLNGNSTGKVADSQSREKGDAHFEGMFVANKDIDLSPINNIGPFISIDGRPVASRQGVLKDIVDTYKFEVRELFKQRYGKRVTNPLIILNLKCSRGSYDVNIEPAKDDVLFNDAQCILSLVTGFLKNLYSRMQMEAEISLDVSMDSSRSHESEPHELKDTFVTNSSSIELAAAEKANTQPENSTVQTFLGQSTELGPLDMGLPGGEESSGFQAGLSAITHERRSREQMCHGVTSNAEQEHLPRNKSQESGSLIGLTAQPSNSSDSEPDERSLNDIRVSNPWTFAKLNSPKEIPRLPQRTTAENPLMIRQMPTPARQKGDVISANDQPMLSLSSPIHPSNGILPTLSHRGISPRDIDSKAYHSKPFQARSGLRAPGSTHLDPASSDPDEATSYEPRRAIPKFNPPSSTRRANPLRKDIPALSPSSSEDPFPCPTDRAASDDGQVWFDFGPRKREKPGMRANHPLSASHFASARALPVDPEGWASDIHPDLAVTLDYEARKQKAMDDHRKTLRKERAKEQREERIQGRNQLTLDSMLAAPHTQRSAAGISPYQNRYQAAKAALQPQKQKQKRDAPPPPSSSTSENQRAHPAKPLEYVAKQDRVIDLLLSLPTSLDEIARLQDTSKSRHGDDDDGYRCHRDKDDLIHPFESLDTSVVQKWETRLRQIIPTALTLDGTMNGPGRHFDLDLRSTLALATGGKE